jgi:UDP-N-acetylmuramyl pentapeptide phosphotransferase/UDP-N-acetylglucosamine-1-phosphate transferase
VSFVIAAIASLVLTPLVIAVAPRLGLVDRPGALKVHTRPIPLAGAAVAAAAAIAVLTSQVSGRTWLAVAIAIATATGLLDDLRALGPLTRLALQAAAGTTLLAAGAELQLLGAWGGIGLVFVAVAAANAVNMLDGQDGLAPGLVAISGLGLAVLVPGAGVAGLAAAGAASAFLAWNRPPARAFLGDAGAYALGVLLASGVAQASLEGWSGLLAAGACLGVFAYELSSTVVRRIVRRTPALAGDRDHAYDRLTARVGSRTTSTYLMWSAGGAAALIGLLAAEIPAGTGLFVIAAATAVAASIHVRLETPPSEAER